MGRKIAHVHRFTPDSSGKSLFLLGDEVGAAVRRQNNIDSLDKQAAIIEIVCSTRLIGPQNSWIRGFFRPTILHLAKIHNGDQVKVRDDLFQRFHIIGTKEQIGVWWEEIDDELPRSLWQYHRNQERTSEEKGLSVSDDMSPEIYRLELDPSGQATAGKVRHMHNLDQLDQEPTVVEIVCPKGFITASGSFVRGLLRDSVIHLIRQYNGDRDRVREAFWSKFRFVYPEAGNVEWRWEEIEEEIRVSLIQYNHDKERPVSTEPTKIINLAEYAQSWTRPGDPYLYAARPRGEEIRERAALDQYDQQNEGVLEIHLPPNTMLVQLTFLLGLLAPSVATILARCENDKQRAEEEFMRRFVLVGFGEFSKQVREFLDQALVPGPVSAI